MVCFRSDDEEEGLGEVDDRDGGCVAFISDILFQWALSNVAPNTGLPSISRAKRYLPAVEASASLGCCGEFAWGAIMQRTPPPAHGELSSLFEKYALCVRYSAERIRI